VAVCSPDKRREIKEPQTSRPAGSDVSLIAPSPNPFLRWSFLASTSVPPPSFLRPSSVPDTEEGRRKDGGATEEGGNRNGGNCLQLQSWQLFAKPRTLGGEGLTGVVPAAARRALATEYARFPKKTARWWHPEEPSQPQNPCSGSGIVSLGTTLRWRCPEMRQCQVELLRLPAAIPWPAPSRPRDVGAFAGTFCWPKPPPTAKLIAHE